MIDMIDVMTDIVVRILILVWFIGLTLVTPYWFWLIIGSPNPWRKRG